MNSLSSFCKVGLLTCSIILSSTSKADSLFKTTKVNVVGDHAFRLWETLRDEANAKFWYVGHNTWDIEITDLSCQSSVDRRFMKDQGVCQFKQLSMPPGKGGDVVVTELKGYQGGHLAGVLAYSGLLLRARDGSINGTVRSLRMNSYVVHYTTKAQYRGVGWVVLK